MRLTKGIQGSPDFLAIEGRISPDGTTTLQASGLTGHPLYSGVAAGTPYSYVVKARFDGARGSGERMGSRSCEFAFTRQ